MFDPAQLPFTAAAAFFMSLQPILVSLSKNAVGTFDYSVPASTMLSELLKLGISSSLLLYQCIQTPLVLFHEDWLIEFISFMLPAVIYFVNNNCLFFILQEVDPTTFQLLSQMKTILTGLLFRLFLKRYLTTVQYLALLTLACGTAVSQLPNTTVNAKVMTSVWGVLLSLVSSLLSALGGIYSEKLLKNRPSASIHWQNIQLYLWGVVFNAVGFYWKDGGGSHKSSSSLLAGFGAQAWLVVICNALNGLAISAVLKYADNIARVYAHAIAMMVTMVISIRLFGAPVTPQLVLAIILVATSTFQYNLPPRLLASAPQGLRDAEDIDAGVSVKLLGDQVGEQTPGNSQKMQSCNSHN